MTTLFAAPTIYIPHPGGPFPLYVFYQIGCKAMVNPPLYVHIRKALPCKYYMHSALLRRDLLAVKPGDAMA